MRRSKLLFSSILATVLGMGVIGGIVSKNTSNIERVEASVSFAGTKVFIDDAAGIGWTQSGVDPVMHMWDITFDSSSVLTSVSLMSSNSFSFGSEVSYNTSDSLIDVKMTWTSGGTRPYSVTVPWFITGFKACFYAKENGTDRYWKYNGSADAWQLNATRGQSHNIKLQSTEGYGPWWDGSTFRCGCTHTSTTGFTYSVDTQTVTLTASPAAGGTVTGAGTYKQYSKVTISASANTGYSFSNWSDNKAASHSIDVKKSDVSLTATFVQIPALATPVLSIDSENNITWNAVSNAQSYSVTVDGVTTSHSTSERSVAGILKPGTHTVSVVAKGDGVNYGDSASASKQYTVSNGFYIVGDFNSWNTSTFEGAVRMDSPSTGKYTASLSLAANNRFEVVYATSSSVEWQNWGGLETSRAANTLYPVTGQTGDSQKSVTVTNAGNYNVSVTFEDFKAYYKVVPIDYFNGATFKLYVGSTEYTATQITEYTYTFTGVSLTSGQVLSYKRNSTTVSVASAKLDATNNLESSRTVVSNNANATVVIDVFDATIYSNLGVQEGFHMLRNGVITTLTRNESPSDPSFIEYYSEAISFSANETIRFVDVKGSGETLPVVFDVLKINSGGLGNKFDSTSGVLKAKEAVTSAVYLKLKSGNDEVYFGTISEAEQKAIDFAAAFNSAISSVCNSQGGTTISALRTAWQTQKTNFGNLLAASKTILKNATESDHVETIREFVKKYIYVASKYTTQLGDGYNFLNKTIPNRAHFLSPLINSSVSSSSLIVIVLVLGITGLSVGGYFLIRRKKQK